METGLTNVLLLIYCTLVNNINDIVEPESVVTMLNDTVDNIEQCGQQNNQLFSSLFTA